MFLNNCYLVIDAFFLDSGNKDLVFGLDFASYSFFNGFYEVDFAFTPNLAFLIGALLVVLYHTYSNKGYLSSFFAFSLLYPIVIMLFFKSLGLFFIIVWLELNTFVFLLLNWSQFKVKDERTTMIKIQDRFLESWYHPKYLSMINFWSVDVWHRKPVTNNWILVELCLLLVLSLVNLIYTRYIFVTRIIIIKLVVFGNYYVLVLYFVFLAVLTLIVSIPAVQTYFYNMYGPKILKDLGWNHWFDKIGQSGKVVAGSIAGIVLGKQVESEFSYQVNKYNYKRAIGDFNSNYATWSEAGVTTGRGPNLENKPKYPNWEKDFKDKSLLVEGLKSFKNLKENLFTDSYPEDPNHPLDPSVKKTVEDVLKGKK